MARYNYSMDRREKKVAGVCSTIGETFNVDPTFVRIGFVAVAILVSWKLALVGYIGAGIYMHIQRNKAVSGYQRRQASDYDRMEDATRIRPTVHTMRTQLDETDRRLMAIDDHINSTNDELAREIEALREEK